MQMEHTGTVDQTPVIECRGISKSFHSAGADKQVIANIDLMVRENEFLVILGPGQCGKTTLINLLAGLEQPTAGDIFLKGKTVKNPGPERGVVYQTTALFPWLTVMGNVEYGPKMCGIKKEVRQRTAQHFIDLVGLQGFEDQFPVKLSGGMQQRVGIARAYANGPVVLLMDEPFGHLDAQTRYLMEGEIIKIWEQEKKAVVFVTNNIEEALFLADRIVLLSSCPAKISREYCITLPRPRAYTDPAFLALREEITQNLDKSI